MAQTSAPLSFATHGPNKYPRPLLRFARSSRRAPTSRETSSTGGKSLVKHNLHATRLLRQRDQADNSLPLPARVVSFRFPPTTSSQLHDRRADASKRTLRRTRGAAAREAHRERRPPALAKTQKLTRIASQSPPRLVPLPAAAAAHALACRNRAAQKGETSTTGVDRVGLDRLDQVGVRTGARTRARTHTHTRTQAFSDSHLSTSVLVVFLNSVTKASIRTLYPQRRRRRCSSGGVRASSREIRHREISRGLTRKHAAIPWSAIRRRRARPSWSFPKATHRGTCTYTFLRSFAFALVLPRRSKCLKTSSALHLFDGASGRSTVHTSRPPPPPPPFLGSARSPSSRVFRLHALNCRPSPPHPRRRANSPPTH